MSAATSGYGATFYNPAALTLSKHATLGIVGHLRAPSLTIDRESALGADTHPSVLPEWGGGASLGWTYPLRGIFQRRLALGVALHVPVDRLVRVQGVDRLSPHFAMHQNLSEKMMLSIALGAELLPWLSLGVGLLVHADLRGAAALDLDIIDGHFRTRAFSVDIVPTASVNLGLHVRPIEALAIGVTWRSTSQVNYHVPVQLTEGDALKVLLDVAQSVQFAPHRVSLGAAYTLGEQDLSIALDAVIELWSFAPDPSPRLTVDLEGAVLAGLGLGDALDVAVDAQPVSLGFSDIVTLRVGTEWRALGWLSLRAGYCFRPTPAPPATGDVVYLDNDSHTLALGFGLMLLEPRPDGVQPLSLDVAMQSSLLVEREALREAPDDPVGTLHHGGQVWNLSLSLSHAY